MLKKYNFALPFYTFSVTTLLRDSVTKQSKTDREEHKSKINFQLSFFTTSSHTWCLALNLYAPLHCQLLFYFTNINHVAWVVNNFSTIEWFQQTFENRILVTAKLKHPRKLRETRFKQSFKNITGCMLLECIAMSAFSLNFNLSKKSGTFDFRGWILLLQIYNFINLSQTQIRENVDKRIIMLKSCILTGNYCQLSVQ